MPDGQEPLGGRPGACLAWGSGRAGCRRRWGQTVGTGWDPRQRVCAYTSYAQRDTTGDGGQWFVQSTVQGLLSLLGRADAQLLAAQNQALSQRLMPGQVPPGPAEAFQHYLAARADWPTVAAALGGSSQADAWTTQLLNGLRGFAAIEGW